MGLCWVLAPFDLHILHFMTRPNSGSDVRRTIVDLSCPKVRSVIDGVSNNIYLGTELCLHYPFVDSIIRTLNQLGSGASIFKLNISRAFYHIPIDPGDIDLLGLQHWERLSVNQQPKIIEPKLKQEVI